MSSRFINKYLMNAAWLHLETVQNVACQEEKRLRPSSGSVLAFGTQVRGFAPGQSLRIFRTKKIISTPSFGGEVKTSAPCRSFTSCKRFLKVTCKSAFRQNLPDISRPQFHLPSLGALAWWHAWRRLVAKVGTSNQDRTISLKPAQRSCINKQTLFQEINSVNELVSLLKRRIPNADVNVIF